VIRHIRNEIESSGLDLEAPVVIGGGLALFREDRSILTMALTGPLRSEFFLFNIFIQKNIEGIGIFLYLHSPIGK
jgi:hypothetical protein